VSSTELEQYEQRAESKEAKRRAARLEPPAPRPFTVASPRVDSAALRAYTAHDGLREGSRAVISRSRYDMTNANVISHDRYWIEEEITNELNVELEAARRAYSATMGGANETKRAHDRYVKAIRNAEAFADIRHNGADIRRAGA